MAAVSRVIFMLAVASAVRVDKEEYESPEPHEVMIAQESRNFRTVAIPPVRIIKPKGVTNSHRPQYDLDSLEEELANLDIRNFLETTTRRSLYKTYNPHNTRDKESMIRDAVLRALERKDHVGKFAQILPIVRAMSGSQRVALASLVASQVSTPPGRAPLNLSQVRSMFGNENNNTTSELMLPILLDMANLIRRAVRTGKETRDVKLPPTLPQNQLLRRSFVEDTSLSDEFDPGVEEFKPIRGTTKTPNTVKNRNTRNRPERNLLSTNKSDTMDRNKQTVHGIITSKDKISHTKDISNITSVDNTGKNSNTTKLSKKPSSVPIARGRSMTSLDNVTLDLTADATNQTAAEELPVAEKLRSLNRFADRKGNVIRRGIYNPKLSSMSRRTTAEPSSAPSLNGINRRRPFPTRKQPLVPGEQNKCELFTNTVCLHTEDYPTEAIVQSIRRNKAAAGALLADVKDPGEGAVDGISPAQEAKYTAEHYLLSNRRGDTANRDFASAGEAGFMCPSTVKYARPQRARATSGQWKYIVNTGEHTQTLRLEKCLKPKESCTYLTDNFQSKCVQVYNYHRLLTWDQQNGLHMDIFKVPTCCSCHIEGYSVSFPPLGHRTHETSSEHFPGEDLSSENINQAFETVQSTIQKPTASKKPSYSFNKHLETFPPFIDSQNTIPGPLFVDVNDDDELDNIPSTSLKDSYGNSYYSDTINQASSIRNIRKPSLTRNSLGVTAFSTATLPSYLEPPSPSGSSSFSYIKDSLNKYKTTDIFKRGISRQQSRPIRKKMSNTDDLVSSGTSAVGSLSNDSLDTEEELTSDLQNGELRKTNYNVNVRPTIAPKLHAITESLSTINPQGQNPIEKEEIIMNSKRVNYNYHPIIDFFEVDENEKNESIDREDNVSEYMASSDSEWKPINHPIARNGKSKEDLKT